MKFIVLFLGSTTLVAGGTAITPQQDVRNNVITNKRPHQEHREGMEGACCFQDTATCVDDLNSIDCLDQGGAWQGWGECSSVLCISNCENAGIFSDIARPIELSCAPFGSGFSDSYGTFLDIDGDGNAEQILNRAECSVNINDPGISWNNISLLLFADNSSSFGVKTLLNIHPSVLTYEGLTDFGTQCYSGSIGYFDVTGDGLLDQLLRINIDDLAPQFFYVENISEAPASCATDINNDGSTNVNDLLAVVGNWGPCE